MVAFTATQIPEVQSRIYPLELARDGYTDGVSIYPEKELPRLMSSMST
ncbi:MAG: hypothetical protein QXV09_03600 [Candidatus Bathyarchaeia archaeon]